jgi:sugar (pentulose or hexulose) kinase
MNSQESKKALIKNETYLGIEIGSTRIKAVLIDKTHNQIASGSHTWENRFIDGIWTYSLEDIWTGIRHSYSQLATEVSENYGIQIETVGAMGVSAMMHGYMAFDKDDKMLASFRTWRNTCTGEASKQLTELFGFNIPQRWSIAHLYQAILNEEEHVPDIRFLTTLAGFIHWQLTGEKVLGVGDASGMFPIDNKTHRYDAGMLQQFDGLTQDKGFLWKLCDILPKILHAGEKAGALTEEGARLLDSSETLKAGIQMCPPEGDAGTGMVATNSVRQRTGNISAGTSVFAMVVMEKPLRKVYTEIDMVTTPSGDAVAMVHCNNCSSDLDSWLKLLGEAAELLGAKFNIDTLYSKLLNSALSGNEDCGGLLSYNYISGEPVTGFAEGRPLFMRMPDAKFNLANFMRMHLYSACASLNIGMKILLEEEDAEIDSITGHGGFFKDANLGSRIMAAAMGVPVTVMATAGEGGPWGMAVLAAYMQNKQNDTLADYLSLRVFPHTTSVTVEPVAADAEGFMAFMKRYDASLAVERAAVETLQF